MKKNDKKESIGYQLVLLIEEYINSKELLKEELKYARHYNYSSNKIIEDQLSHRIKSENKSRIDLIDFINEKLINK